MGGLSAAQPANGPEGVGWQVSTQLEPCVLEARSTESTGRSAQLRPPILGRAVFIVSIWLYRSAFVSAKACSPGAAPPRTQKSPADKTQARRAQRIGGLAH